MDPLVFLLPLFFLTALLYSTAGLGGGSTYLALLSLFSFSHTQIPQIALICNLIVVTGGFYFFARSGYFSFKRVLPFILTSIPLAYVGGRIPVSKTLFGFLLGFSLLAVALRLLLSDRPILFSKKAGAKSFPTFKIGLPVGALLGLVSGLVGIGGGIFLSPVLLLMGWADAKQAAASASFFILVNSCAGLLGQMSKAREIGEISFILPLGLAVFLGAQVGSRLGSGVLSKVALQRVTAVFIFFVALRLFWQS